MDVLEKVHVGEAKGERGAIRRKDRKRPDMLNDFFCRTHMSKEKNEKQQALSKGELKS